MSTQIQHTSDELEQLTLPQLQARFREVIGETTRCPNRRFLIRRIEEALAARNEQQEGADSQQIIEGRNEPASPNADTIETTAVPMADDEPPAEAVETAGGLTEEPASTHANTIEMTSVPALDDASPEADRAEAMSESTADDTPANATEASDSTLDEPNPLADTAETTSATTSGDADPQANMAEIRDEFTAEEAHLEAHVIEASDSTVDEATPQADTVETPSVTTPHADSSADTLEPPSVPTTDAATPAPRQRGRFGSMTVEQLQAKYLEVVGRPSGSSNVAYLVWKIREAEKGRITIGPRQATERNIDATDVKILPLRLEAAAVERMDEAWRARGMKSRMEFLRRALGHYLTHVGADDAAAMFAGAGSD